MRIKKSLCKMIAAAFAAGSFAVMPLVSAEVKEYEGFGEYVMSDFETPDVAKQRAKARAEQNAMEQAGVYVESYTKVINHQVTHDEIVTMTNGILKVKDVQYKMMPTDDGKAFLIHAMMKADIDTEDVSKWLEQNKQQMNILVEQNRELQRAREEQERKIESLQKEIASIKTVQEKDLLQEKFVAADKGFLSNQKTEQGHKLLMKKDYAEALVLFSEAIELDQKNEEAKALFRGAYPCLAHERKEIYKKENMIKRCSKYEIMDYISFYNSGINYILNGEIAISYFTKAIALYPDNFWAYYYRGLAYGIQGMEHEMLDDYKNAISNFTKVIKLQPKIALIYQVRGITYHMMGDYVRANEDFSKARGLKS